MENKQNRGSFSGRLGFVLAAAGSVKDKAAADDKPAGKAAAGGKVAV